MLNRSLMLRLFLLMVLILGGGWIAFAEKSNAPDVAPSVVAPPQPSASEVPTPKPSSATNSSQAKVSYTGKILVLPVGEHDLTTSARFQFMSKTLKQAAEDGAAAIIFELDTPGGLAWDTTTFAMQDLQKLKIKTFSFVNPRALSAGALIAAGTDAIYMSPASSIGAASPVMGNGETLGEAERAKMNSAIMSMARSVAVSKGHLPQVLDAMIDKDVGLKIGDQEISPKGRILTLTAQEATQMINGKPLFAKGIVASVEELVEREKLRGELLKIEPKGFEYFALLISQYAPLLIGLGVFFGFMEIKTPGFGIPGLISIGAFTLFFFGHYVAGSLVGYELVVLFILGVILLLVEFFVFPGLIVPGLIGAVLIGASLLFTMGAWDYKVPEGESVFSAFGIQELLSGLSRLILGLLGGMALSLAVMRFLPKTKMFSTMVLATDLGGEDQVNLEGESANRLESLHVGMEGVSVGALRPYGNAQFGEQSYGVKSEQNYVEPNQAVKIVAIEMGVIIVRTIV